MIVQARRARAPGMLAVVAVLAIGCTSGSPVGTPTAAVATGGPSTLAATTSPTAAATPILTPIPTPASSANPLPDGDYVSGVISHASAAKKLSAPSLAADPGVRSFLGEFKRSIQLTLRLAAGHYELLIFEDGVDQGVGSAGTYAFPDSHTMVSQEPGGCLGRSAFVLRGQQVTWKLQADSCGAADQAVGRVIYESTPWTRKP